MRLRQAFLDRTSCLIEHERGQYVCPLADGVHRRLPCPIHCKQSNGAAIANRNTLIYTLINLRFLQRLRADHLFAG